MLGIPDSGGSALMNHVKVDFAALQEIAVKGVRRTAVFLGLGINAAADPCLRQYQLSGAVQFRFIPNGVDDDTLTHFKEEFSRWIVACGFRELIETFSVFLDEVHRSCLVMRAAKERMATDSIVPLDRRFRRHPDGLHGKLDDLRGTFGVEMSEPSFLLSINKARNCLVHRLGSVSREDCSDGRHLTVVWRGIDICIETESGETVSVHPMSESTPTESMVGPPHGWMKGKYCQRRKVFPIGSVVSFLPGELAEICHFFIDSTSEVVTSAQAYPRRLQS
jgi:hypothetical protein